MIVRYDYHAIRHFITLYAKDDDLLNLPLYLADRISEIYGMTSSLFKETVGGESCGGFEPSKGIGALSKIFTD